MSKNVYYGTDEAITFSYLEFGSIDLGASKKDIWDFRIHDKAYDWFMLSRYANDMVTYTEMSEKMDGSAPISEIVSLYTKEMHHKADASLNVGKICALAVMKNRQDKASPSFFEIGQTIYGCIEGMDFCQKLISTSLVQFPFVNLTEVSWYGVDISDFFNRLSVMLHSAYKVKTVREVEFLKEQTDVFFSKGVTLLYIVREVGELLNLLAKGEICVFDYSFSMEGVQNTSIGTGKHVRYLDFNEFYKAYNKGIKKLFVRKNKSYYNKATNRIFIDCVYAEEGICREFIDLDIRIRKELMLKLSSTPEALILLDAEKEAPVEWISIEEFVEGIKS